MGRPKEPGPSGSIVGAMNITSRWLTAAEAAEALRVDVGTLRRWAREGRIPVAKTPGGRLRFAREDLVLALSPGQSGEGR